MVGVLVEFPNMSTEQAAQIMAALSLSGKPPVGQVLHIDGPMEGGGTRVVDVWESIEAFEAFIHDKVEPLMGPMGIAQPQPTVWPIAHVLK